MRVLNLLSLLAMLAFIAGCKEKKPLSEEKLFPVLPILQSQIAAVDSSVVPIRRYIQRDSTHTDTIFIDRQEFKKLVADFLELPDISQPKYASRFRETTNYDESLDLAIIHQEAVDKEDELIQNQEILIKPSSEGDKVKNIIINTQLNKKKSSIQKRMLWNADQGFLITTIAQEDGKPETVTTVKVDWELLPQ